MGESEIQSLITLVRGCGKIMLLLLLRHRIPFLIPLLVNVHIKQLCSHKHEDVVHCNANQYAITAAVQRLIVIVINLQNTVSDTFHAEG